MKDDDKNNEEYRIFLVPHTHYDAVWVFTKEDYFYINIELILKKAVRLMERDERYRFLIEQTYLLEEIEKRDPKLFEKIKRFVKKGNVEIADGEYLMADTMLPQGETLIREIMFGKRYVREKFGTSVHVLWQADSFGLNAQLPQIYRKCGYRYVAFRRGCPEKKPSEFIWEGLDGSRIISHWMPLGYRAGLDLDKLEESYLKLKELAATKNILMPSGSGVTLPQEDTIAKVEDWNKKHREKIKISTPSEFFKNLEKHSKNLPVRKGEMFSSKYSEVFPDVASSRIWIKKSFRELENTLLVLERFACIKFIKGCAYPQKMNDLWKSILFLAFHDVIPGTGIDDVYEEAKRHINFLRKQVSNLLPQTLKSVVEPGDERGDIAVFNPLSWEVKNWVEVELNFDEGEVRSFKSLESEGEVIDVDVIKISKHKDGSVKYARLGFFARVPPLGYRVYKLSEKEASERNGIKVKGKSIENKFFRVEVLHDKHLVDVFVNGKLVCSGNELVIEEECGDLYTHKEICDKPIKTESGEGVKYGVFKVRDFRINRSNLRVVVDADMDYYSLRWPYRLTEKLKPMIWRHNFIKFKKKVIIYRDVPRIDFITSVENKHPRVRLRVKFDTKVKDESYTCETQFGAVSREANMHYKVSRDWKEVPSGVFPSQFWIDYSSAEGGITLINRGNPENEVREGNVYLTLLRSVSLLCSDGKYGPIVPVPDAQELNNYTFTYSIYPHEGSWKMAKSYKHGYEFNQGLIALQVDGSKKYKPSMSFLKIEPHNVVLTALKKSEDGKFVIIRFYEAEGRETDATITFFRKVKTVASVNMLEEEDDEFKKDLSACENNVKVKVKPFEVVSLKLKF